ncbi:MAG: cytochrome C oxidase subunit IV family protein [Bacteroidales bacterium]|nr:cytochrome C oxidase subunit IV family protein [Bacteroidales bacterium]MCF8402431.1 cytochrome C oxidase subunit IV family protein [Bacteroidales bacterium]
MSEKNTSRFLPGDPKEHHIVPYKFHIGIWVGLIILTVMTVLVSVMGISLVAFSVVTALIIATAKAVVVVNYFMHLKYDNKIITIMLGITLLLFAVFIIFTAFDYLTR